MTMWTIPGLSETNTEARLLNAALRCFARYGYARASMTDIAEEAGLSRTILYKHYKSREDAFRALSIRVNQGVRRAVVEAAKTEGDYVIRLQAVVAARVGWAFEALQLSAHGRDLIDAKNEICGAAGASTEAEFSKLLARIIASAGKTKIEASVAADIIVRCLPGLIAEEISEAAAREKVAQFVRIFAAGLVPDARRGAKSR
ncbi:MAG: helix-turn-helix domain-containing protein [Alphaproteobacteria bacterium]|nr:helix-turn-helix domain-containing protein [Alphaproteobacteria bacterium]